MPSALYEYRYHLSAQKLTTLANMGSEVNKKLFKWEYLSQSMLGLAGFPTK